jgi:signal transduction histidine kinase
VELQNASDAPLRRVIGIGSLAPNPPEVWLVRESSAPREMLAQSSGPGGPLVPRYFTYQRARSFDMAPGESVLLLVRTDAASRPTMGVFREGELGRNQVIATLIKAGFTSALLFIAIVLAAVSLAGRRWMGLAIAGGFALIVLHGEAPLFTAAFGGMGWTNVRHALTVVTCAYLAALFLDAFRASLPRGRWTAIAAPLLGALAVLASGWAPSWAWPYYLALVLYAAVVAFRFDIAKPLRLLAGAILLACTGAAIAIDPALPLAPMPDLTVEFTRDVLRLIAGLAMLLLVLFDVRRGWAERERIMRERLAALEAQAEADRRLIESEREYQRAREAAIRHQRQLSAASHDIRQPLAGLRTALRREAPNMSESLNARLGDAVDYLERLTEQYSDRNRDEPAEEEEEYPLDLVLRAVADMFAGEATDAGVALQVMPSTCRTRAPALGLMRATSNLVANALRHAQASRVLVGVRHAGGACVIEVRDNGRGMDADQLATFTQRGGKGASSEGDGLGLAIIGELAERHGFAFHIDSTPGKGTRARLGLSRT